MLRFAANLSFLYQELPFLDRFAAAAADGFAGVEYLFPYDFPAEEIAVRLRAHRLEQVLFNLPPGDWHAGERGIACLPGRQAEFAAGVDRALRYAEILGNHRLHVMAGIPPRGADSAVCQAVYLDNLRLACARLADAGRTALIEPINTRDMPGYLLTRPQDAQTIITAVGAANLRLQMDFYHLQITVGDLSVNFHRYRHLLGHVQIAGVPDRREPDGGEVNYPHLFGLLEASGYDGWIGCEYRPRGETSAGLGWLRSYREQHGAVASTQSEVKS